MDDSSQQLDAWESTTSPQKPPSDSGRMTGIIVVAGIIVALFILTGLILGWTFGVQRPATAAATNQAEATLGALSSAGQPPDDWDVLLEERFDTNRYWPRSIHSSEYGTSEREVSDGVLNWHLTTETGIFSHELPAFVSGNNYTLQDFLVSVEANQTEGELGAGSYGLIFRHTGADFYFFEVIPTGAYTVLINRFDKWDSLIGWTEATNLDGQPPHKITVRGEGSHFTFFINDRYIAAIDDDQLSHGRVGVGIELEEDGKEIHVEFDNLLLYEPPIESTQQDSTQPTPRAARTPTSTAPPEQLAATAAALDADSGLPVGWTPLLTYDFEPNHHPVWDSQAVIIDQGTADLDLRDGWLIWNVDGNPADYFYSLLPAADDGSKITASDGYMAVNFETDDPARAGIIFRYQNGQAYAFEIGYNADYDYYNYQVVLIGDDSSWKLLKGPHGIRTPDYRGRNRMAVIVRGNQFDLYFNGEWITSLKDDTLTEGEWGLSVSLMPIPEPSTMTFDNLVLYVPNNK